MEKETPEENLNELSNVKTIETAIETREILNNYPESVTGSTVSPNSHITDLGPLSNGMIYTLRIVMQQQIFSNNVM